MQPGHDGQRSEAKCRKEIKWNVKILQREWNKWAKVLKLIWKPSWNNISTTKQKKSKKKTKTETKTTKTIGTHPTG